MNQVKLGIKAAGNQGGKFAGKGKNNQAKSKQKRSEELGQEV